MIIEVIEVMIDVVMTARTTSGRSGAIIMIVVMIVVIGHDTATTVENVGHHVQLERESRCS